MYLTATQCFLYANRVYILNSLFVQVKHVAVPLQMCLDALFTSMGNPLFDVDSIEKILKTITEYVHSI